LLKEVRDLEDFEQASKLGEKERSGRQRGV